MDAWDGVAGADFWTQWGAWLEAWPRQVAADPVETATMKAEAEALVRSFGDGSGLGAPRALELLVQGLRHGQVHTASPRYFGQYHATPHVLSAAADALVSMANPQLSTGHHGAFAVRAEQWLLRQVVEQLGLGWPEPDGQFTTGGEEANAMALQCALVRAFPAFARQGLRGLPGLPTVYASEEAHGSLVKAVRGAGLGEDALRLIPVDKTLQVKVPVLRARIAEDRKQGFCPVLLVATAGTTIAGSLDPLDEFRAIAQAHGLWFHVDAAWGGLLAMVPERAHHLQGWAAAHSVTFDPHKALAMPLGTGMFLTRERGALDDAFCVKTRYMPTGAPPEPYQRSRQWSRRFLGARLLLPLLAHGWEPFRRALAHQCVLGDELKARLAADQWEVANRTPLPVACFTAPRHAAWGSPKAYAPWARSLMQDVWIVPTRLPGGRPALRACITSHRTTLADVDHLVQRLNGLRSQGNDLREESTPLEKRKGPAEETGVRTT